MAISVFRQQIIEMLIAEDGEQCRYCRVVVRKNFVSTVRSGRDATIDHVIPKAKGGTNDRANLALACSACNNAKGDRDLADFLADPRPVAERGTAPKPKRAPPHVRRHQPSAEAIERATEADARLRTITWSLAAAIERGEAYPHGVYKRPPAPKPVNRIPTPPMTALETARWLREQAEKKGKPWPLA